MKKYQLYALLFTLVSFTSSANMVATPDNEDICKQQYVKAVFDKQMQFSNSQNSDRVRRTVERQIDRSRKIYSENDSFCAALKYLQNSHNEELVESYKRPRKGESQFKEKT